mmetsp:Transcript_51011/g.150380  ORF Transcript_51011/g.150380 Transcript_51011/m.150380 type:complete len:244 (-) Transcript_51011:512-1243(-)
MKTWRVPDNSTAPTAKGGEIKVKDFRDEATYKAARDAAKKQEATAKKEWIDYNLEHNVGSALLKSAPCNVVQLAGGMPSCILPIECRARPRDADHALLAWSDRVELWQLAPLFRIGCRAIDGVRAVCGFEYRPLVDAKSAQYWVVGTAGGSLHLLKAFEKKATKDQPILCEATKYVLPPAEGEGIGNEEAAESRRAPVGISALSTAGGAADAEPATPHSLLYVGFDDGSVRSYALRALFDKLD